MWGSDRTVSGISTQNAHLAGQNAYLAGQNAYLAGQNAYLAGQNAYLAGQNPAYSLAGLNADLFELDGDTLQLKQGRNVTAGITYLVIVEVTGSDLFETGNSRGISVDTTTRPTITVRGDNPATVRVGDRYEDAGADCSNNANSTLPVSTTHSVDTSEPSTHTVTYRCDNGRHNTATATRTVIVASDDAPLGASGGGSPPAIHLLAQGGTVSRGGTYQYQDYNCVDCEDGIINHRVDVSVAAGTTTATITYSCTDRDDNITTATRTVQITDTRPPEVHLHGPAEIRLRVGDRYMDAGAYCVDDRKGRYAATLDPLRNSVDTSTPGTYAVGYYCLDDQGNEGYAARGVTVVAANVNIRPVVSVPVEAIYLSVGDSYTLPVATCTDAEDGNLSSSVETDGEVDVSTADTYEVFFLCTDSAGAMEATSVVIYVD